MSISPQCDAENEWAERQHHDHNPPVDFETLIRFWLLLCLFGHNSDQKDASNLELDLKCAEQHVADQGFVENCPFKSLKALSDFRACHGKQS